MDSLDLVKNFFLLLLCGQNRALSPSGCRAGVTALLAQCSLPWLSCL